MHEAKRSLEAWGLKLESFFSDPRKVLCLALALGGVFALLGFILCDSMYRDTAHCYAYYTASFGQGEMASSLRPELPVIPIAMPGLLCLLGLSPYEACKLAGALCYLLATIPLYFILKRFMEPKYAAWGALLYVLAPKIIRFSYSGLPDTYRNFFIVLSIALLLEQAAKPRLWKALLFGAALAGISLSRGEGLVIAAFQMAAFLLFIARARWSGGLRGLSFVLAVSRELLLACLVFVVCMAPRGYQNYKICGYPVPDARMATHINRAIGIEKAPAKSALPPEQQKKSDDNKKFFSQFGANLRGAYELYAAFAAIGAVLLLYRRQWSLEHSYLLALIAVNVAVFATISISYRYYLINLQVLMPLTMAGFVWALALLSRLRVKPWMLALLFLGVGIGQSVNGMDPCLSRKDSFEREAGTWVRSHQELFSHSAKDGRYRVMGDTVLCFWSGGEYVKPSSMFDNEVDIRTYKDFDVALFYVKTRAKPSPMEEMESRGDMERVKDVPHSDKVAVYRKKPAAVPPVQGGTPP